jgi:hypothetical protein
MPGVVPRESDVAIQFNLELRFWTGSFDPLIRNIRARVHCWSVVPPHAAGDIHGAARPESARDHPSVFVEQCMAKTIVDFPSRPSSPPAKLEDLSVIGTDAVNGTLHRQDLQLQRIVTAASNRTTRLSTDGIDVLRPRGSRVQLKTGAFASRAGGPVQDRRAVRAARECNRRREPRRPARRLSR